MDTEDFCAASVVMDKTRKRTQELRTTYGHHNAPYKHKGSLKAGRMCDYTAGTSPYSIISASQNYKFHILTRLREEL